MPCLVSVSPNQLDFQRHARATCLEALACALQSQWEADLLADVRDVCGDRAARLFIQQVKMCVGCC